MVETCVAVPRAESSILQQDHLSSNARDGHTVTSFMYSTVYPQAQVPREHIPSHRSCIQPFIHRHRCLVSTSLPFKDGSMSWIPSHCILPDYSLCDARLLWWKSMGVKSSRAESVGNLASPKRLVFRENHDLLMKLKGHISHTGEAYTDGSLLTGFL